jgi:hypothetical protein
MRQVKVGSRASALPRRQSSPSGGSSSTASKAARASELSSSVTRHARHHSRPAVAADTVRTGVPVKGGDQPTGIGVVDGETEETEHGFEGSRRANVAPDLAPNWPDLSASCVT